jgi:hypothetical protein
MSQAPLQEWNENMESMLKKHESTAMLKSANNPPVFHRFSLPSSAGASRSPTGRGD